MAKAHISHFLTRTQSEVPRGEQNKKKRERKGEGGLYCAPVCGDKMTIHASTAVHHILALISFIARLLLAVDTVWCLREKRRVSGGSVYDAGNKSSFIVAPWLTTLKHKTYSRQLARTCARRGAGILSRAFTLGSDDDLNASTPCFFFVCLFFLFDFLFRSSVAS